MMRKESFGIQIFGTLYWYFEDPGREEYTFYR